MCLLLLVIYFSHQYMTIHCKSTNKNSVYNKYIILTINLNQFIYRFTKTFYSVLKINIKDLRKLAISQGIYSFWGVLLFRSKLILYLVDFNTYNSNLFQCNNLKNEESINSTKKGKDFHFYSTWCDWLKTTIIVVGVGFKKMMSNGNWKT